MGSPLPWLRKYFKITYFRRMCQFAIRNLTPPHLRQHGTTRTPTGRIFTKFYTGGILLNPAEKTQILLKSDSNNIHFICRCVRVCVYIYI
jgi:hypothetical protein